MLGETPKCFKKIKVANLSPLCHQLPFISAAQLYLARLPSESLLKFSSKWEKGWPFVLCASKASTAKKITIVKIATCCEGVAYEETFSVKNVQNTNFEILY